MICSLAWYGLAFLLAVGMVFLLVLRQQKRRFSKALYATESKSQLDHIALEQQYLVALREGMEKVGTHIHEHLAGAIAVLHRQVESRLHQTTGSDEQKWLLELSLAVEEVYDVARTESHQLFYREADKAEHVFASHLEKIVYAILPAPAYQLEYGIDPGALRMLVPDQRLNLLLVIREALVNIDKHAKAKYVSILFYEEKDGLILSIKDDGIGFDTTAPARYKEAGIGLPGMKRTIDAMNGRLEITSGKNGTEITVTLSL